MSAIYHGATVRAIYELRVCESELYGARYSEDPPVTLPDVADALICQANLDPIVVGVDLDSSGNP